MQARTERRLGFVAASLLTAAAFVIPATTTQLVSNEPVVERQIELASALTNHDAFVQLELERAHQIAVTHIK